ncbi:MAG: histidine phosphatase family protein [Clostridia bacterium]|nr:histidine phosphatase family protein [Clostridia bacterium]
MKLVIIRHGDPIYVNDTLTPKGEVEADLLGRYLKKMGAKFDTVYCSPRGRAQKTCIAAQKELGFTYETLPWMREFSAKIFNPTTHKRSIPWDLMPSFFTGRPLLYDSERWMEDVLFAETDMKEKYEEVKNGLEVLLAKHGYERDGSSKLFRAVRPNTDTVVLFCHFGLTGMMMSILTGFSPYVFWQHFCSLPTSVTTIVTEEREEGKVSFRCIGFGELSHLALGGEEPSFAARFPETFHSGESVVVPKDKV